MKRWMMAATVLCFAAAAVQAEDAKKAGFGVFGGVTAGGDLEDEGSAAYGAHMQFPLKDNFFAELSFTSVSDESSEEGLRYELDVNSIGLSVGANAEVAAKCAIYGLIGGNYNIPDDEFSVDQAEFPGASVSTDTDDAFGFHAAVGSTYNLTSALQLMVEYRYTFLELEGDFVVIRGDGAARAFGVEGDFDFGVIKAGLTYLF